MRRHSLPVLIFFFLVPRLAWPQGEPLGPEFRVNTVTGGQQIFPSVASGGGDFVVVWRTSAPYGIAGQRFDGGGNPLGTEFRVNQFSVGATDSPAVGANASGGFVVVWEYVDIVTKPPMFAWSVFGQRYAASGAPVGAEFNVNGPVGSFAPENPVVAVSPSGAFVVVWGRQTGPLDDSVFARLFDSSGLPQGPEFRVNTYTTGDQGGASVAADPAGNFVVVWADAYGTGYGTPNVVGRRFAPSGAPLGPEFRVNTYTGGQAPAIVTDSSGDFTVAWGPGGGVATSEIFGQRFASDGVPLGPQFQVNTTTTGKQVRPAIAADGAGNFVIVWWSGDYLSGNVFGQRYSSLGEPSGTEFRVNTATLTSQMNTPSVASAPEGTFLVVWHAGPIDGNEDIFGQRFGGIFPVELMHFRVE